MFLKSSTRGSSVALPRLVLLVEFWVYALCGVHGPLIVVVHINNKYRCKSRHLPEKSVGYQWERNLNAARVLGCLGHEENLQGSATGCCHCAPLVLHLVHLQYCYQRHDHCCLKLVADQEEMVALAWHHEDLAYLSTPDVVVSPSTIGLLVLHHLYQFQFHFHLSGLCVAEPRNYIPFRTQYYQPKSHT